MHHTLDRRDLANRLAFLLALPLSLLQHLAMNLPTRFDFREVEPRIYHLWMDRECFESDFDPDGEPRAEDVVLRPRFVIAIPPPNVTGRLHMGHALNNTLQDVLIRFKRMDGHDALWVPGTDHAGIATQTVVRKQLDAQGIDYRELGREKFIEKVWEWKDKYGNFIIEQLKKMGCSCDWRRTRFTMDEGLSRAVRHTFKTLYDRGLLYRGKRIVNWCPVDRTALSDDEVMVSEEGEPGHLWYIRYPLLQPTDGLKYLVVATTRPETLFGDVAVAVNPKDERYTKLVGSKVLVSQRPLRLQDGQALFQDRELLFHLLVVRTADLLVDLLDARFEDGHIGEDELRLEGGDIAKGIDAAVRVRHRVVSEETNHLNQRVVGLHRG